MAVTPTNQDVKAKLVYKMPDEGADTGTRQTSRTFSNIKAGASDQNIYDGLTAVALLLDSDATGINVVKVTEATLVNA